MVSGDANRRSENNCVWHWMSKAFVFPGQGSQAVGMGKALAETFPQARAVMAEVDDALGQNLSGLMFEGSPDELTLTANAQPALLAVSLAAVRVLESEAGLNLSRDASFVAGHSLGEYSALTAAGSLGVGAAAKLLRVRGLAMQDAVPVGTGAMAALLGLDYDTARAIAKQAADETGGGAVCEIAKLWYPGPAPQFIARPKSQRGKARAVRFCCRCRRRFIAP